MKKLSFVLFFLCFSLFCLAATWQDKSARLQAIDEEISKLMEQKKAYELLKDKINTRKTKQPKIALVLSGGGAKGAAHIGVLKVLEKYQVPIDMIIGTSVGSIVGGMYAIGYTSEEIEQIILHMEFKNLLTDFKDRNFKTVETELGTKKYPFQLNMDKNMNISIPKGLVNGQNIYLQLKHIFSPATNIKNFDNFPIVYRAITTNLEDGKQEILKEGDLSLAVFRSMAIPALISPVEYQGKFYADGGIVNNFPVDIAINMGADIIIGVDITADTTMIDDNSNIISVLDKISSYNGNKSTNFHKKLANILITPDVKKHNTVNFSSLEPLILEGEKAAEKNAVLLKKLSNPIAFEKIKNKRLQKHQMFLPKIEVIGNQILSLEKIKSFDPKPKTHIYSTEDLERWVKKIYAYTYVDKITYSIQKDVLHFEIKEKKEIALNFGLAYSTNYGGSLNIAMNIPNFFGNFTRHLGANIEVSEYPKIDVLNSFSYQIGKNIFYGQGSIFFHRKPMFVYEKNKHRSTYLNDRIGAQLSLGTELVGKFSIHYDFTYELNQEHYGKGEDNISVTKNYQMINNKLRLHRDTLNKKVFPTEGALFNIASFTENSIDKKDINAYGFEGNLNFYKPIIDQISLLTYASFGKIISDTLPLGKYYKIGGNRIFNPNAKFIGAPLYSILSKDFYILGLGTQYQLLDTLHVLAEYNYMEYSDLKNKYKQEIGYGIGLGFSVLDFPVILTVSQRKSSPSLIWEFSFGYRF